MGEDPDLPSRQSQSEGLTPQTKNLQAAAVTVCKLSVRVVDGSSCSTE